MLTIDEARQKGLNACIDLLGREFMRQYKHQGCAAWGVTENGVFCFVAISTKEPQQYMVMLDSTSKWSCCSECTVSLSTGEILGLRRRVEAEIPEKAQ